MAIIKAKRNLFTYVYQLYGKPYNSLGALLAMPTHDGEFAPFAVIVKEYNDDDDNVSILLLEENVGSNDPIGKYLYSLGEILVTQDQLSEETINCFNGYINKVVFTQFPELKVQYDSLKGLPKLSKFSLKPVNDSYI
ncbi:hypothetical protein [Stenotrophomonas phage RAS14]